MVEFEVLLYHPYHPDVTSSNYMFYSMTYFSRGHNFNNFEEVEKACRDFLASEPAETYRHQIEVLVEKWTRVIQNNGLYF